MRNMKWLSLVLIFAIMIALIAGCTKKEAAETPKAAETPATTQAAEASPSAPAEDKTPLTITWFVDQEWYQKQWDADKDLLDKMITEATGISVNVVSGSADKLSAMIASGDIPDVVTVWNILPQRVLLEKSGMMAPLDEFIPKYAPTFNVPKSMQDWYRNPDGHYYGLPNYFVAPEKAQDGDYTGTHINTFARQDIMKQLNINTADFDTKEGTLTALRKVKEAKVQYNGFTVVPAYFDAYNLQQMFGAKREDAAGNYIDRDRSPEALEAFKFLNQLYREGLLPEDSQTMKNDQIQQKIQAGSVFAYTNYQLNSDALFAKDPNALFVTVGPIKGAAGNPFTFDPTPLSGWTLTMMNKNVKNPERVLKFFEFMSSDEMSLNAQYGPKGSAWNYDDNNKVKYTEERNADYTKDSAQANQKYGAGSFPWFINWFPIQRTMPAFTTEYEKARDAADKNYSKYSYNGLAFEAITPAGGTDEAKIASKVDEVRVKMHAKMILTKSEVEVEKIFNEMLAQEDKLGYQKLYDYQNQAFKAAKKKLGLEFAWPANQK